MSLYRLCGFIVMYLLLCSYTHFNTISSEDYNCASDFRLECNFPVMEFYGCASQFPVNSDIFLDSISNSNEDGLFFEQLGVQIYNAVNPVIITVKDSFNNPQACSDSLILIREYHIDDGVNLLSCTRTIITLVPGPFIIGEAQDKTITCSNGNIEGEFQAWLNNKGGMKAIACKDPILWRTVPVDPKITYSCSNQGSAEVKFVFTDDCGNNLSSVATFYVTDTLGPETDCTIEGSFQLSDPTFQDAIISEIHSGLIFHDNCGSSSIESIDFEPLTYHCSEYSELDVSISIQDECGNSTTCLTTVEIENDKESKVICPNPLYLLCESENKDEMAANWLQEVEAFNPLNEPINVYNNYIPGILDNLKCGVHITFEFFAIDDCSNYISCFSNIHIEDNKNPEISCPEHISVETNQPDLHSVINSWASLALASDNCHMVEIEHNLNMDDLIISCQNEKSVVVDFTAYDECDNSATCNTSIEVVNDYEYGIECMDQLEINCGADLNQELILELLESVHGWDNNGQVYPIVHDHLISDFLVPICDTTFSLEFIFEDPCLENHYCTSQLKIVDDLAPSLFCPEQITVNEQQTQLSLEEIVNMEVAVEDNCNTYSTSIKHHPLQSDFCDSFDTYLFEYATIDACGNKASCSGDIKIPLKKDPTINCNNDLEVECSDPLKNQTIQNWLASVTAFDFEGNPLNVLNSLNIQDLTSEICLKEIIIEFYAEDECERPVSCSSVLSIVDSTPPVLNCPDDLSLNSTDLNYDLKIHDWIQSYEVEEDCTKFGVSTDLRFENIDICEMDSLIVSFKAEDECDNLSECRSKIYINKKGPVVLCPDELSIDCINPENILLIEEWIDLASSFNNSGEPLQLSNNVNFESLGAYCNARIDIHFYAVDDCGVPEICTTAINIKDTSKPQLECPEVLQIENLDVDAPTLMMNWIESYTASDCNEVEVNTDIDLLSLDISCLKDTIIAVQFNAIDKCSNKSECLTELVVENTRVTTFDCPDHLLIECGDDKNEAIIEEWLESAKLFDNSGGEYLITNNYNVLLNTNICGNIDTIHFKGFDNCSKEFHCSSTISIIDSQYPVLNCPSDLSIEFQEGQIEAEIENWLSETSAYDQCGLDTLTHNFKPELISFECDQDIQVSIKFLAVDNCGLTVDCQSTIYVHKNLAPEITCPSNLTISCLEMESSLINTWLRSGQAIDHNGLEIDYHDNFNTSLYSESICNETVNITFSSINDCGLSAICQSSLTVIDTVPPVISCPDEITINASNQSNEEIIKAWLQLSIVEDHCNENSIIEESFIEYDYCDSNEILEYTVIGMDKCGNSSSCKAYAKINSKPPIINCPPEIIIECNKEILEEVLSDWVQSASAYDNANQALNIEHSTLPEYQEFPCSQTLSIQFQAFDPCEQKSSCTSSVTLQDSEAPVIVHCPENIEIDISNEYHSQNLNSWINSVMVEDNCSSIELSNTFDIDIQNVICTESQIVNFVATDFCSNQTQCTSQITLYSQNEIFLDCPEPVTIQCGDNNLFDQISDFTQSFEAQSSLDYEVYNDLNLSTLELECTNAYTQFIEFYLVDECDNNAECETHISFLPQLQVYIPNVFSPNGDGQNDRFTVYANEPISLIKSLMIVDRWGNNVFNNSDFLPNEESSGWDGLYNNNELESSVYTYYAILMDESGEEYEYIGTISLVK